MIDSVNLKNGMHLVVVEAAKNDVVEAQSNRGKA
jgi:hypothetical protein